MLVAKHRPKRPSSPRSAPLPPPAPAAPLHTMAIVPTAWGVCGVLWKSFDAPTTPSGFLAQPPASQLCKIITPGLTHADLRLQLLAQFPACHEVIGDRLGNFHPEVVPEWFADLVRYLQAYYSGALRDSTDPRFVDNWAFWRPRLHWSQLTPFQQNVLDVVASIKHGVVMTYADVARRAGNPKASRAVGAAVGANPWPPLVPCHRVVGSNGKLTGFSAPGGVDTKRRMLAMESPDALF